MWAVARRLDAALAGRVLTRTDFRVPRWATTDLTGRQAREVRSRGKHVLIRVAGGLTIHTHLRMDGFWRIGPSGGAASGRPGPASGRPLPAGSGDAGPADHRIRLILANDRWLAAGYLLGTVAVLPTEREHAVVGHLGPDLLGPDWDADEAVRRLLAAPGRPVGEALLDQASLAGIGNLYKAEVLFLRGVSPWRPVADVPDLAALVGLAKRLLEANKDRAGQVTTGNPARGQETWVYGRAGRPCRRCGTRIRADGRGRGAASGERVTFWCPACQPG